MKLKPILHTAIVVVGTIVVFRVIQKYLPASVISAVGYYLP